MRGQYCSPDLVRLGEGGDDDCAGDGATLLVHLLPGGGHGHLIHQILYRGVLLKKGPANKSVHAPASSSR